MMRPGGAAPIIVLSQNTTRESGHQVQAGNIAAAKVLFFISALWCTLIVNLFNMY